MITQNTSYRRITKAVVAALCGATLLQAGGCINSLVPTILALGEQVVLSAILERFTGVPL